MHTFCVPAVTILPFSAQEYRLRGHSSQRFYFFSMAVHPRGEIVASGQRAGRTKKSAAHVRVWNTKTLETLHVIGNNQFQVGIGAVAFSVEVRKS